ncbi:hypothetical protein GCM10025772_05570 [Ferrimonas gelatinilytica]|uniref:Uncharacterized protein n=1 Tax=Ferrimonas gelatinilytica TaxID=1255257 RepID=A0ABP9RWW8_9GAMM
MNERDLAFTAGPRGEVIALDPLTGEQDGLGEGEHGGVSGGADPDPGQAALLGQGQVPGTEGVWGHGVATL